MAQIGKWVIRALVSASGLTLAACASTGPANLIEPKYDTGLPPAQARQAPSTQHRSPPRPGSSGEQRGGTWKPYEVRGKWYYPEEQPDYDETGLASWYGDAFNGKPTATGETFDMYAFTAAHKTLPLPSIVEVTNLDNGRSMQLRVNDRGPFVDNRIIDLSRGAADQLGMLRSGLARVRVRYVGPAPTPGLPASELQYARAEPPRRAPTPKPPGAPSSNAPPAPRPEPAPVELAQAEPVPTAMPAERPHAEEAPSPSAPSPLAVHYEIQAGAFSTRANAERAARQLAAAGSTEIREMDRNGQTLYRVFVSRLDDEAQASDALEKVASAGYQDAVLRRLN